MKVVLATDGSAASRAGFDLAISVLHPDSKLFVVHVYDPTKNFLPYNLQPENIRQTYEVECISRFPHSKYDLLWVERDLSKSCREIVMNTSRRIEADFMVVGFHGRKADGESTVIGSSTIFAIRTAPCPLIVCKSRPPANPASSVNFSVCVDGSATSFRAFHAARKLLQPARGDKLRVLHVSRTSHSEVESRVRAECEPHIAGCGSVELLLCPVGGTVVDKILEDINENNCPDLVFFGADGVDVVMENKKFLGSVCDSLMRQSKCSVCIVK